MITIDHTQRLVTVAVMGEFTLDDFREFEEYVLTEGRFDGALDLLFDLNEMAGFTVDMALEEIKFSRTHGGDFRRIAIVTHSQWVAWSTWLEQLFVSADLRVFDDPAEAHAWLTIDAEID
ncbi:MAG: STAS/SEC14 domain-containing protein [Rhodocyclaceae bacterium]|nr:STAS/SEC14 domain-containing protein [Rhodocyclaceae bacterium]